MLDWAGACSSCFSERLCSASQANVEGEKRPNEGPIRIHVQANLAPEAHRITGQQCLNSDREVAKKGLGEGKGLYSR